MYAWLKGRAQVQIEDIQEMVHDVFRHRMIISEHAILNGRTIDDVVDIILEQVPLPKGYEPSEREKMINRARN